MNVLHLRKWRLTLAALAPMLAVLVATVAAILLGVANPPYAVHLLIDTLDPAELQASDAVEAKLLALSPLPMTIEVRAANHGSASSAWGLSIIDSSDSLQHQFLVDNQGYIVTELDPTPIWRQFIHAKPGTNTVYLHIDAAGSATFRVNGEIAWTGSLSVENATWGITYHDTPELMWEYIRVYRHESESP